MSKSINGWTLVIIFLVLVIASGSIVIWSKYSRSQAVEISIIPERKIQGEIYVGGEVNNPGVYPLESGDGIGDIIRAAGGASGNADMSRLNLFVPGLTEGEPPQKVDINRAEVWLLQSLPGIGEVRAQAIVDYRQQNGPFQNINELVKVEGIGTATYEQIRHLITVAD